MRPTKLHFPLVAAGLILLIACSSGRGGSEPPAGGQGLSTTGPGALEAIEPSPTAQPPTPTPRPATAVATTQAPPAAMTPTPESESGGNLAAPAQLVLQPTGAGTGIPEVDAVIEAILANDAAARLPLVRLAVIGCTHADGLGGPPKCQDGEAEGTPVEVLPILGPEGHHVRQEVLEAALAFRVQGLYAVYTLSENVWDSADFPRGEIGLLFLVQEGPAFPVTVHATDGAIVRLDHSFGGGSLAEILEREAAELILAPPG